MPIQRILDRVSAITYRYWSSGSAIHYGVPECCIGCQDRFNLIVDVKQIASRSWIPPNGKLSHPLLLFVYSAFYERGHEMRPSLYLVVTGPIYGGEDAVQPT